jgi:hypothetical protein
MKKVKLELDKKATSKNRCERNENNKSIEAGKSKSLIEKECRENYNFKKEVIIKEDGRYLIYYEF